MKLIYQMRNVVIRCSRILIKNSCPASAQQTIINSFPEPADTIDRAYFQYKATMQDWSFIGRCLAELAAYILLPLYIYKLKQIHIDFNRKVDMICFLAIDQKKIIAEPLKQEFPVYKICDTAGLLCIDENDWAYLKQIFGRYKRSYYFKLKVLLRMAAYSAHIKKYNPNAFVSAAEHSFSNTLCTWYCEKKNIENIVCQHGEYWRRLSGSFFYVHRYYTWNEYYIELHKEHRAYIPVYFIEVPASIMGLGIKEIENPPYFATYYLGYETKKELAIIREAFDRLRSNGKECKVRLHPRGRLSNESCVRQIFHGFYVEDCNEVTLGDSINNSDYLMSICSTVLLQGYLNNKKIIIDDISNTALYENLKSLGYVMLSKEHIALSEIMKENANKIK